MRPMYRVRSPRIHPEIVQCTRFFSRGHATLVPGLHGRHSTRLYYATLHDPISPSGVVMLYPNQPKLDEWVSLKRFVSHPYIRVHMLPTSVAHVKRLEYDPDRDGLPISMEKAHRTSQLLLLCTGTTIERGGRVQHGGLST